MRGGRGGRRRLHELIARTFHAFQPSGLSMAPMAEERPVLQNRLDDARCHIRQPRLGWKFVHSGLDSLLFGRQGICGGPCTRR